MTIPSFPMLPMKRLEEAKATISNEERTGEGAAAAIHSAWEEHAKSVDGIMRSLGDCITQLRVPEDEIVAVIKILTELPARPSLSTTTHADDASRSAPKGRTSANISQRWIDWANELQLLYDHLVYLVERYSPWPVTQDVTQLLKFEGLAVSSESECDLERLFKCCLDEVLDAKEEIDWRQEEVVEQTNQMANPEPEAVYKEIAKLDLNPPKT